MAAGRSRLSTAGGDDPHPPPEASRRRSESQEPPRRLSQVVFAAGQGTRLRPLTEGVPKALVPVLDVPLVDLALARGSGVAWASRFVNVSHHGHLLREHLGDRSDVTLLDEGDEPLGTGGTLRRLLPELEATVITYNCDLVADLDLERLVAAHVAGRKPATLAVRPVAADADLVPEDGHVRLVDRRRESRAGFLFLGAACFERDVLERIEPGTPLGLTEGLLQPLVDDRQVAVYEHPGYARDTGTHQRYLQTSIELLARPGLVDPPGAVSGDARSYVGPGARVEEGSLGSGAIVLAGAEVGAGAALANCIVWPGERVPADANLGGGIYFDGRVVPA